jgi:hypothetical protein
MLSLANVLGLYTNVWVCTTNTQICGLFTYQIFLFLSYCTLSHWRTQEGRGCPAGQQAPPKAKLKNTNFVDVMKSKVLCDIRFSLKKLLKSTDD